MAISRDDPSAQRILDDASIRFEAAIGPLFRRCSELENGGSFNP
jgi:hypothetical protein